jgi:hypothetical protein
MKITGKLYAKMELQQVTASFRKREFVVEYAENPMYPQLVKFEASQDRCEMLDKINVGDQVEVTFNLRGREWTAPDGEKKYFTTLDAWRVEKMGAQPASQQPAYDMVDYSGGGEADDLPF